MFAFLFMPPLHAGVLRRPPDTRSAGGHRCPGQYDRKSHTEFRKEGTSDRTSSVNIVIGTMHANLEPGAQTPPHAIPFFDWAFGLTSRCALNKRYAIRVPEANCDEVR